MEINVIVAISALCVLFDCPPSISPRDNHVRHSYMTCYAESILPRLMRGAVWISIRLNRVQTFNK